MLKFCRLSGLTHASQRGFSLIELSVVVVILSIVSVFGMEMAAGFVSDRALNTTRQQLVKLDQAIDRFYGVYGRLPCPAVRSLGPASTSFGLEDCTIAVLTATTVRAGDIPFRTLNLPMSAAIDGYGNKFNYFVTAGLTVATTFAATAAGIEMRTGRLQQPCSSICSVLATDAAYAIFSNGYDGRGARSRTGVAGSTCAGTNDTRVDAQNCFAVAGGGGSLNPATIAANVLYDSRYNNGSVNASFFDDLIIWRSKGQI